MRTGIEVLSTFRTVYPAHMVNCRSQNNQFQAGKRALASRGKLGMVHWQVAASRSRLPSGTLP